MTTKDADFKSLRPVTDPKILDAMKVFAMKFPRADVPALVVDTAVRNSASAGITTSGKHFIAVGIDLLKNPDEAIAAIAHEFGHVVNGDLVINASAKISATVRKHNDPTHKASQDIELRADDVAIMLCPGFAVCRHFWRSTQERFFLYERNFCVPIRSIGP